VRYFQTAKETIGCALHDDCAHILLIQLIDPNEKLSAEEIRLKDVNSGEKRMVRASIVWNGQMTDFVEEVQVPPNLLINEPVVRLEKLFVDNARQEIFFSIILKS